MYIYSMKNNNNELESIEDVNQTDLEKQANGEEQKFEEPKEKKIAIGYTVKALGENIKRLKKAKLITEEEETLLKDIQKNCAIKHLTGEQE